MNAPVAKSKVNNNRYSKEKSLAGGGRYLFRIEVSDWPRKWGLPPYLGKVWADDEYWAVYVAYDRLNFPRNDPFKPKPVRLSN